MYTKDLNDSGAVVDGDIYDFINGMVSVTWLLICYMFVFSADYVVSDYLVFLEQLDLLWNGGL